MDEFAGHLSLGELKIDIGNMLFLLWKRMPEPKLPYLEWYCWRRMQSLSEAIEGYHGTRNLHDE